MASRPCVTIGIHAVAALRPKPTGVEHYTREILRRIVALPDARAHRFFLYTDRQPTMSDRRLPDNAQWRVLKTPLMWTQARLSFEMILRPPEVLFVPAQALPRILPKRTVVTIHGWEFEHCSQGYASSHRRYLQLVTRDAVRRAQKILVPSETTKQDTIAFARVNPNKVIVIPHGAPTLVENESENVDQPSPYFLYIGRLETKKNVDGIVRAFAMVSERLGGTMRLILAGAPGFGHERIRAAIDVSSAKTAIEVRGYVSEEEKWILLRGATGFLFPSFAEGFGFPILEAQYVRTPVITGATTAMPEVAGRNGALFVSPGDDTALAEAMETLVRDATQRSSLITAGISNVQRFSWDVAAKKTLDVLLGDRI